MSNTKANKSPSASPCRCFVRHAITPDERKAVSENLDYFRSIGDQQGIMISVAQLCPCPRAAE